MNIFLIGLRGSGKSTIGRQLATALRLPFIDLDERVLANFAQPTVRAVWKAHGEPAWRAAESSALDEVTARSGQVVALGGGTPMIESARKRLEQERRAGRAFVVYLRCALEELRRRLGPDEGDRPSLGASDAAILAQREPVYRALADVEFDVTGVAAPRAVEALRKQMPRRGSAAAPGGACG